MDVEISDLFSTIHRFIYFRLALQQQAFLEFWLSLSEWIRNVCYVVLCYTKPHAYSNVQCSNFLKSKLYLQNYYIWRRRKMHDLPWWIHSFRFLFSDFLQSFYPFLTFIFFLIFKTITCINRSDATDSGSTLVVWARTLYAAHKYVPIINQKMKIE